MLALFFVLGRLLSAFCILAAFVLVSGRFLCILERSTVDFGVVKDAPGRVLEAPTAYFTTFFHAFACTRADGAQKLQMCKNHSFSQVFPRFLTHRTCCTQDQKQHNIAPEACRTELSTKIVLKTRLGACRALLGRDLKQFWMPLGRLLAGFWLLLGGFWTLLGAFGRLLGALGRHLAHLRRLLGAF